MTQADADTVPGGRAVDAPVRVRSATTADAAAFAAIYAPVVRETAISFEIAPPGEADMAARIAGIMERFPCLVAERDRVVVGYAYASPYASRAAYATSVDVTVYVAGAARRGGVGRALYGVLLPRLAAEGFHAAVAAVTLPNRASVALHEAFGFRQAGVLREIGHKFGVYHDVGLWQRIL